MPPTITPFDTTKHHIHVCFFVTVCGYTINHYEVFAFRFDESWGIDALIGLDFFRRFRVTIDYKLGHLITEPL